MNTSVEKNNPEVLSGNKTGGIHSHKSLISPSNQKKKTEKTQHSTKQNKTKQNKTKQNKTRTKTCNHKNAFSFQS